MSHQSRKIGCVNYARFPKSSHLLWYPFLPQWQHICFWELGQSLSTCPTFKQTKHLCWPSICFLSVKVHCKNCHVYITQNFVWNFGQKILHFFCVTVTYFSLCVALENFCVLNTPILFHIRLLLCNINPQLHLLHITIIHKKQTCPMKIKLHNLHIMFNTVFCPLSIPWMLYPLFSTSSSQQT